MTKRIALVTGAAGPMGLATAQALMAEGHKVAMADMNREKIERLARETGGYAVVLDVADRQAALAACDRVEKELGPVDILVNNAGILSNNKSAATTPEEWRKVLSINLDGAFWLSQRLLPGMKERRWGRIVNTCSFAMKSGGLTAGTAYTVSKAALQGLTFSLARESTGFGVTVNGIAPAHVNTPMVTEQLTEVQRQALLKQIPVGRFCEPEEFAHCVRFFVSPLSGFITGEILDLNGGLQFD